MSARPLQAVLEEIRGCPPARLGLLDYRRLAAELDAHRGDLTRVRLVLLASYTTTFWDPYLTVEGARLGLGVEVVQGGYGQLEQALAGGRWHAADGALEVLVLAMRLEDLDEDLPHRFHRDAGDAFEALGRDALGRLSAATAMFRELSSGPVLIANFAAPEPRPLSVFEAGDPDSLTHRLNELNRELARRTRDLSGALVWDYAGLVGSHGAADWTDARLWALSRSPVAARHLPALASHLLRSVRGALRPRAKCLVVDLDDTLWGGAIGDEGIGGIVLGDDHPGSAYKRFQRAILGLRDRGVLLAICSSNDETTVADALDRHPEMLVRGSDFSARRINWEPKSSNLRAIAEELSIGLDSLVFFDDNPVVRAEVRSNLPEVLVVEVPPDPSLYVDVLASVPELDTTLITQEDRLRPAAYVAETQRRAARGCGEPLEDFLATLEMSATIGSLDDRSVQRVTQLVAKTNQFNTTTRRRTQAELEALADGEGAEVCWLRLSDRYGDMGIICVGILRIEGSAAIVDSLILSCRAANRGVEQALVAHLARVAVDRGCGTLVGEYIPSAKNHPVRDLFPSLGFTQAESQGDLQRFRLDLGASGVDVPAFIALDGRPGR